MEYILFINCNYKFVIHVLGFQHIKASVLYFCFLSHVLSAK